MFPINVFVSERRAASLLAQIRWRDSIYCPRCRDESAIRYGSYRVFQRYRCENCDRTFNDKTGTVFEHSSIPLKKWYLAVYTDGFRAYEPLDEDDAFDREYVVHGEGEYADEEVHVDTCESHASLARRWLSPHRGVSKDKLTAYLRAVQLRKRVRRKPGDEALKTILKTAR